MTGATVTVVISTGDPDRETAELLAATARGDIISAIYALTRDHDAVTIYVDRAHSVGEWEGTPEHSHTTVAVVPADAVPGLRKRLAATAHAFDQDAIALTVGETELVTQ